MRTTRLTFSWAVIALPIACGGTPSATPPSSPSDRSVELSSQTNVDAPKPVSERTFPDCRASQIEADLKRTPVEVPTSTVDTKKPLLISTTYLALTTDPKGQAAFRSSMTEMIRVLPKTPGLVSFRFATSESCLSARTLAVWKDEVSMMAFVNSPEHHAAMRQINALSRGTSTFAHWEGSLDTAEWEHAASELAAGKGPVM